jgi:hypothetical protein
LCNIVLFDIVISFTACTANFFGVCSRVDQTFWEA